MKYSNNPPARPSPRPREPAKKPILPANLEGLNHQRDKAQHGKEALARGDFAQALVEFEEASKGEPTDARHWLRLAETHSRLGHGPAAVQAYHQAARIHTEQGFYRHAIAIYKNLLALVPNDIDAHRSLAQLFQRLGLMSDATLQYEYLIKACHLAERGTDALDALRRIVELNPNDVRIALRFVDLAFANGQRDEAIAHLRDIGAQLKSAGRIDEYLRVAERLLAEEPRNMALARDVAKGYIVRGNGRHALSRLKMCFDKEPRDAETLDLLAQAFDLAGQRDKAVALLKALGQIHRDQGRPTESQDAFHRALDLNPVDAEAQELLDQVSSRARRTSSIDIDIEMVEAIDADAPRSRVTEEQTLKNHMPGFITSEELKAIDLPPPSSGVFDLFPIKDAKRLVAECQGLIEKTADRLRRLSAMLPAQMNSREMIDRAVESLTPGSEVVTEMAMLAEALSRNQWVSEVAPPPDKK